MSVRPNTAPPAFNVFRRVAWSCIRVYAYECRMRLSYLKTAVKSTTTPNTSSDLSNLHET
jgi:hypothetical protein